MSRPLIAALGKLRQAADARLPGSGLSGAQKKALDDFAQRTGCVATEPSGRGVIYRIAKPEVLERHWRNLSPVDTADLPTGLPDRAANIATARSSKSARHGHDTYYLLLKSGPGPAVWSNASGHRLDLRQTTDQLGAAALAVQAGNTWSTDGDLWLVENQALFDRLDWMPDCDAATLAYYSGQLNNQLLDWLAEQPRARCIRFFPDYDGVGLLNYARIREHLGDQVQFWLMPNWRNRLARFGNAELLRNTQREFQAAYHRLSLCRPGTEVMALIETMSQQGLALEQEAVWLE